jgi:ureidoacrylate peracid hydrolase
MVNINNLPKPNLIILPTEPEPLEIDLRRTAVVVIDMTNAFVRKGAFFDLRGVDVSRCEKTIEPCKKVITSARNNGCPIIYIAHRYSLDLSDAGGPGSLNWYKSSPMRMYRQNPELKDKLFFRGTWGAEIIDELKPEKGDIVIDKPRYSSFAGTNLDMTLRSYNIKYSVFIGIATNGCVEASIRDAYNLDYWSILIPDACANTGPAYTQETTIWNVKLTLGWVVNSQEFVKALEAARKA